jgi:hypothetical protein
MKRRFDTRIIIERAKRESITRRIVLEATEERRPADATETAVVAW